MLEHHDAVAHAEIEATRTAGASIDKRELRGATLYSILQLCGMCTMASIWSKVGRIVYGAVRSDVHQLILRRDTSTRSRSSAMPIAMILSSWVAYCVRNARRYITDRGTTYRWMSRRTCDGCQPHRPHTPDPVPGHCGRWRSVDWCQQPPRHLVRGLVKPSFNPPDWLFAPAWTVLYVLIAVAGWRTFQKQPRSLAMGLWYVQLALNFAWSPIIFSLHAIALALIIIVVLLVIILDFITVPWGRDRAAALLFVP